MKIDLHLHTLYGSACAYMDPDQLIQKAKAVGLDGVCLTEHNQLWDPAELKRLQSKHDLLVLGGMEVSTEIGEILVFGLHREVPGIHRAVCLRQAVEEEGGFLIAAHPFRFESDLFSSYSLDSLEKGRLSPEDLKALTQRPLFRLVDALEVYNGRAGVRETAFTAAVAAHLRLPGTGGSDAHAVLGIGACYTRFPERIRSEKDFLFQLKAGRFQAVDTRWSNLRKD